MSDIKSLMSPRLEKEIGAMAVFMVTRFNKYPEFLRGEKYDIESEKFKGKYLGLYEKILFNYRLGLYEWPSEVCEDV